MHSARKLKANNEDVMSAPGVVVERGAYFSAVFGTWSAKSSKMTLEGAISR